MGIDPEDFYDFSPPRFAQQGDIFPNLPLINIPPSKELVLIRAPGTKAQLSEIPSGQVEAVRELSLSAFDNTPEYVVVSAVRGLALLVTQTCDLADSDTWLLAPVYVLEGSQVDRGNLFADKYPNLFALPAHPAGYFPDAYISLNDLRPVRSEAVQLADRIASLSRNRQNQLTEKLATSLSRRWGYAPGEEVPVTGKYKCDRCNRYYGMKNPERELRQGEKFPQCEDCRRIHKTASWYPLTKHKKS